MPVKPLEVEHAGAKAEDPAFHRARLDAAIPRHARRRFSVGENSSGAIDDDLDASDLAGQRIPGEHPLAVKANPAARQRHLQRPEVVGGLEPTVDATAREREIAPLAARTPTPNENFVAGAGESYGVAARFDVEYENHVL